MLFGLIGQVSQLVGGANVGVRVGGCRMMIHPHGSCFCWAGFTCRFTVARSRCSEPHTFLPRPIQDFFFLLHTP